jgi:hypothetical protein
MKRLLAIIVALAPAAAGAFSVQLNNGDSGSVVTWPMNTVPIYLDADGTSDIAGSTTDLNAVRNGFNSWNNVTCSALVLSEVGTVTSTSSMLTSGYDDKNVFVWLETSQWTLGQWVLGVTLPATTYGGDLIEADIVMNGYSASWSTTGGYYDADIESVAVHELGHLFGLQHVLDGNSMYEPPTMAPAVDPELRTRSLTQDDRDAACFLYPSTPYTCSVQSDCPMIVDNYSNGEEYYAGQLECDGDSCSGMGDVPAGTKQLGDNCNGDLECASGMFCQPVTASTSYCGKSCNPDSSTSCPAGFECVGYSNSAGGVCLEDSGGGGGGGGGVDCTCDDTYACDSNCACDPECGCACDETYQCDSDDQGGDCACDPECNCACDETFECDGDGFGDDCGCDPECLTCLCDETTACDGAGCGGDGACECDEDCGEGCAANNRSIWRSDFVITGAMRARA